MGDTGVADLWQFCCNAPLAQRPAASGATPESRQRFIGTCWLTISCEEHQPRGGATLHCAHTAGYFMQQHAANEVSTASESPA